MHKESPRSSIAAILVLISIFFHFNSDRAIAADAPAAVVKISATLKIDGDPSDWKFDTAEHAVMGLSNPVAWFKLAYDNDALYALVRVQDASPLRNQSRVPEELFKGGDAIGLCFGAAGGKDDAQRLLLSVIDGHSVVMLQRPLSTEKHPHRYAADANRAATLDYVAPCDDVKVAFQTSQEGYVAEVRVPWSVLGYTPADMTEFPFDLQVEFSDAAGTRNVETRWWHTNGGLPFIVTDIPTEAQLYPQSWGRARLTETDPGPQPQRAVVDDEADVFSGPGTPIHFTLPRDCKVSIAILDDRGWIVRELIRARKFSKGDQVVYWNGRDRTGQPCPAGNYRYRLGYFDGIKASFYGSVGNSGRPIWKTEDGLGSVGGVHGGPGAVAADATGAYLLSSLEEGQPQFRKIRPDGTAIWFSTVGCSYTRATTVDAKAERLYVAFSGPDTESTLLSALDTKTGKLLTAFGGGRAGNLKLSKAPVEGLVVAGNKVWFSVPTENRVGEIDLATEKPDADISLPNPQGMVQLDAGHLLVCSGTSVHTIDMTTRKTEPLITELVAPRALAIDEDGNVYVSDLGGSQQIKKFSSQGKSLATFGKQGGRAPTVNHYDPLEFQNVKSLAVAPGGTLWATEGTPLRRYIKMTTDGKWQEDFYGPITWGAPVVVDLDDPTSVYYQNHFDVTAGGKTERSVQFIKARMDYEAYAKAPGSPVGTWKVEGLLTLPPPSKEGNDWYTTGAIFTAHNGKRYFWYYSERPSQVPGRLFVWENDAWKWAASLADPRGVGAEWSDTNGDGLQQPDEIYKSPLPGVSWNWIDRDLNAYCLQGKLKPTHIDDRGVPFYEGGEFTPNLKPGERTLEAYYRPWTYDWIYPAPQGDDNAAYFVAEYGIGKAVHGWDISAESRLIKIKDGKVEWMLGHHDGRMLHEGDSDLLNSPTGECDGVILSSDILGQFVAYSTDGLNLGWAIVDENGQNPPFGPIALYIENALPGRLLKDPKTGKHLLFCVTSEDVRVFQLTGVFGNEITRSEGELTLPSTLPRTRQTPGLAQIPYGSWEPPLRNAGITVHGNDWLWPSNSPAIAIRDGEALVADVRLRRDAGQLCIFADVLDETPFPASPKVAGEDPASRYGKVDGVELLIGPAGEGDRTVPGPGDTRIFLTLQRDKADNTSVVLPGGIAMACRPASPALTATSELRALNPSGNYDGTPPATPIDFRDGLRVIPGATVVVNERLDGHGYRLEAEIPLALFPELTQTTPVYIHRHRSPTGEVKVTLPRLDFTPQPLRFNAAIFRGDAAGGAKRIAWVDDGASNNTDPRAMSPGRWGWANAQVDVNWLAVLGAISYNVYRSTVDHPAAATRLGATVAETTITDPRPPAMSVYWLAPVDAHGLEGQWIGPARPRDGQANFAASDLQPPVAIEQLKSVEATPGMQRVLNVNSPDATNLSVTATENISIQAIARDRGVWTLITSAPADAPLGGSWQATAKITKPGAPAVVQSLIIQSGQRIDLMAGLEPGNMEKAGRWQFQDSGGWKLINHANAVAELLVSAGRPWPVLAFSGTNVDASLEYRLPSAPPAARWSLSGCVQYDAINNSGGPTSIEVLDEKNAPLVTFTHERGAGPWLPPSHRQTLRLNDVPFYVSDLSIDALRGAWQPFKMTVSEKSVTLSYAGRPAETQPVLPGVWQHPAVVRILIKGPDRSLRVGELRFESVSGSK